MLSVEGDFEIGDEKGYGMTRIKLFAQINIPFL